MTEIWKDIEGYVGKYQVSNLGNVRSLNYGKQGYVRNVCLKTHNRGYLQVELHDEGISKTITVHRLVADAFVTGKRDGLIVNHKDEDKHNNKSSNLDWCNNSHNVKYSIAHRRKRNNNTLSRKIKNTEKVLQCFEDGTIVKRWGSAVEVKHILGYSDWSIAECCRGKRKRAYGYIWRYAS